MKKNACLLGLAVLVSLWMFSCTSTPTDTKSAAATQGQPETLADGTVLDPNAEAAVEDPKPAPPVNKKTVMLVRFVNKSPFGGDEIPDYVHSQIKEEMQKHPEFDVVKEEDVEGHDAFRSGGDYFFRTIFDKAKAYGASGVIAGVVEDIAFKERGDEVGLFRSRYNSANAVLRLQVFDVVTEKEVFSEMTSAEVTEEFTQFLGSHSADSYNANRAKVAVTKALQKVYPAIATVAKRIGWIGHIAKVDLHRYYINAGEMTGIYKGELLSVYGETTPVRDPASGDLIGAAPGRYKGILRVIDHIGKDGAIAIVYSGNDFREKDRVEIYVPRKYQ